MRHYWYFEHLEPGNRKNIGGLRSRERLVQDARRLWVACDLHESTMASPPEHLGAQHEPESPPPDRWFAGKRSAVGAVHSTDLSLGFRTSYCSLLASGGSSRVGLHQVQDGN